MSVTVTWDNPEQSILRYTCRDQWNWEELFAAIDEGHTLQDKVDHRVDIILDLRRTQRLPESAISQFRRIAALHHPNTGLRVIVTTQPTITNLFDIFARLYSHAAARYRFATTLDEAYALIETQQEGIKKDEV